MRLFQICGRGILLSVGSVNEYAHMNNTHLIMRVSQGLLAVAATGAAVLGFADCDAGVIRLERPRSMR